MRWLTLWLIPAGVAVALPALGADFYVDPANGSMANDGSQAAPWSTLEEVVAANLVESQNWTVLPYAPGATLGPKNAGAPVKAGDTIWLLDGYHGQVELTGYYNASPITVAALPGHTPRLSHVLVRAAQNWVLQGLSVSPEYASTYDPVTMIDLDSHGYSGPVSDIVVEGCTLQSRSDVSAWTAADWDQLSANGISADGTNIVIRDNRLRNVNFGISVGASDSLVEHNVVDSFAGDGLRGLGDRTTFQYNVVKNCYDVNANHDDGFQSWSNGPGGVGTGEVTGIVLRGNLIIDYEDENQPFRGTLQGIGCFDGTFVDWVVENNVIITDHWHGITLLGARNSRIVNNTVIDPNQTDPGPPWISIDAHKDGTPPEGCLVRNNLTTDLRLASSGVVEDHNLLVQDYGALFVDAASYDLHLLQTAAAVDTGSADLAPGIDIEGVPRPFGSAVDIGAYEWQDGSVSPDGGLGGGAGFGAAGGSGGGSSGGSGTGATGGGSASGGSSASGGTSNGADPSAANTRDEGGCACRAGPRSGGQQAWSWLALALVALRRRR